ncbi:adenosylmethionine decarboxylase [Psychrobium sp. MM17-31]|uniref:adenosylmethionine decarboxylase n=1 Tax=Psychrobium sp. MM17-31 TaxID=2917758 RepID=UPI001EF42598|nr:adenosylmethionine decarboxylase [Psychrobium sp. MM17-31]MCG7532855.1 adenosylmethionine decarboxylase [Psychrobium sp. MM17-31]
MNSTVNDANYVVTNPMIDKQISKSYSSGDVADSSKNNVEGDVSAVIGNTGKHLIADFHGASDLNNIELMEDALTQAAQVAGATLLHIHIHTFAGGGGITGVALLAESHISVHTWPELNYAAFDAFMCGNAQPEKAISLLESIFQPERVEVKNILRG